MIDSKETRLAELLSGSAEAPTERLQSRMATMASDHDVSAPVRQVRGRKRRFAFAASCAATAVVLVAALSPSVVHAGGLAVIQKAMDGARTMHLKMVDSRSGSMTKEQYEVWYQNGCWRIDFNGAITIWRNGEQYFFDPTAHMVMKSSKPKGIFQHGMRGFKITEMLGSGGLDGAHTEIHRTGGPTYTVVVDNKPVQEHYVFTVDSKTDLPYVMHCQKMENGRWVTKIDEHFDFNNTFPSKLFDPKFPDGARVIDTTEAQKKVIANLSKTVATWSAGSNRKFVIHDIEANERGDVFIAYSGPSPSMFEWFDMKDENGNRYIRADLFDQGNFLDRSFPLSDGRSVSVGWWVPVHGLGRFKPVRLHLDLTKEVHKRLAKPGEFTIVGNKKEGSFDFRLDHASTPDLPLFLNSMNAPNLPKSDLDLKRGDAYSLCMYLRSRWVDSKGQPLDDPRMNFYTAASGYHHDPKSLQEALDWAQEELHAADQLDDEGAESQAFFDLYLGAALLDRKEEANGYLSRLQGLSPSMADNARKWAAMENQNGEATKT